MAVGAGAGDGADAVARALSAALLYALYRGHDVWEVLASVGALGPGAARLVCPVSPRVSHARSCAELLRLVFAAFTRDFARLGAPSATLYRRDYELIRQKLLLCARSRCPPCVSVCLGRSLLDAQLAQGLRGSAPRVAALRGVSQPQRHARLRAREPSAAPRRCVLPVPVAVAVAVPGVRAHSHCAQSCCGSVRRCSPRPPRPPTSRPRRSRSAQRRGSAASPPSTSTVSLALTLSASASASAPLTLQSRREAVAHAQAAARRGAAPRECRVRRAR